MLASAAFAKTVLLMPLMPEAHEARGLLAFLLLQDSRRDARLDDAGELENLEDQLRRRRDHDEIDRGLCGLKAAGADHQPGPYCL